MPVSPSRPLQPLARQPFLQTSSVDEMSEAYGRSTTPTTFEPIGRAKHRFHVRMHHAALGPLRLHSYHSRGALRASTRHTGDIYALAFSLGSPPVFRHAGRELPMDVGRFASLSLPGTPVDVRVDAGHVGFELVMPRQVVEASFVALTAADSRHLRLDPSFSMSTPRGAAAMRLLTFVEQELESGVLSRAPLVAARMAESLVHAILWAQLERATPLAAPPPVPPPACVRRAEEYMEANVAEPITLADLAVVSGVSVRALQVGFRAYRGSSPLQFLRNRRLDLARHLLATGEGGRVTDVALACGFEHLGRFSVRYRARFGETPADTLRRAGRT